jgi:hypothetical protein
MALAALVFREMRAAPVASFWNCVEACMQQLPPDARLLRAA